MPFSNPTAIAIALVPDPMDVLLPGVSNLVEGAGFRVLALVWRHKRDSSPLCVTETTVKYLPRKAPTDFCTKKCNTNVYLQIQVHKVATELEFQIIACMKLDIWGIIQL